MGGEERAPSVERSDLLGGPIVQLLVDRCGARRVDGSGSRLRLGRRGSLLGGKTSLDRTTWDAEAGVVAAEPKLSTRRKSCGLNVAQPNSLAKRATSSLEGLLRSRTRRSASRLQISSGAEGTTSLPREGAAGRAASLAGFASGDTLFETSAAAGAGAKEPKVSIRTKS